MNKNRFYSDNIFLLIGVNKEKATEFIVNSLRYDGGFAQCPGMEAHGGSTYCAVASLSLMGTLNVLTKAQLDKLIRWCALRLNVGYQVTWNFKFLLISWLLCLLLDNFEKCKLLITLVIFKDDLPVRHWLLYLFSFILQIKFLSGATQQARWHLLLLLGRCRPCNSLPVQMVPRSYFAE